MPRKQDRTELKSIQGSEPNFGEAPPSYDQTQFQGSQAHNGPASIYTHAIPAAQVVLPNAGQPMNYDHQIVTAEPMAVTNEFYRQHAHEYDPAVARSIEVKQRRYHTGLCGCLTQFAPSCLMAWCCPCFTIARVRAHAAIKEPNLCSVEDKYWPNCLLLSIPGFFTVLQGWVLIIPALGVLIALIIAIFNICICCFVWETRRRFRSRYNIQHPDSCGDCCAVYDS